MLSHYHQNFWTKWNLIHLCIFSFTLLLFFIYPYLYLHVRLFINLFMNSPIFPWSSPGAFAFRGFFNTLLPVFQNNIFLIIYSVIHYQGFYFSEFLVLKYLKKNRNTNTTGSSMSNSIHLTVSTLCVDTQQVLFHYIYIYIYVTQLA